MSAAPGQWPASEVPPPFWQAVVEMQFPFMPELTVQVVEVGGVALVVEDCSGYVQHWISAAPGQWPASDVPPPFWHAVVEMQLPLIPLFTVQVVEVGGVALVVEDCSG